MPEFTREPLFDDWPSLFRPMWEPDRATACPVTDIVGKYLVRLACWGEPSSVFEQAVTEIRDDILPGFVQDWDWVISATTHWDPEKSRIIVEFVCDEGGRLDPAATAELMADYVDRQIAPPVDTWTSGQTAIVGVLPLDDGAESTG